MGKSWEDVIDRLCEFVFELSWELEKADCVRVGGG